MSLVAAFAPPQIPSPEQLVSLARAAVISEVQGTPLTMPHLLGSSKAVFVTIEVGGRVLGCRGSLVPRRTSIADEVVLEARSAAAHDPRYRPLRPSDLKNFLVTVTLVDRLVPVTDVRSLLPSEGLVLESGTAKGIVLPWEGKDAQVRLDWAYRKAGVVRGASVKLSKLIAERYRG